MTWGRNRMTTNPPSKSHEGDGAVAEKRPRSRKRQWIFVAILVVFALALRINLRQGRISGASMEPSYSNGDTVLVWKSYPRRLLKPGDVIVFRDRNGDELIKRIAFIQPGMTAPPPGSYPNPNGGRLIPYSILFGDYFSRVAAGRIPRPTPERAIYVLGDNLPVSDDSRNIGPISQAQILGKVVP
jgi:signal peptidase I